MPDRVHAAGTALCISAKFVDITKSSPLAGAELKPPSPTVTVVVVAEVIYLISQSAVADPFFHIKKRPASPLAGASPLLN